MSQTVKSLTGTLSPAGPQGPEDGSVPLDYDRVLKLFTSRHTAELTDRQVTALRRVVRKNADGIPFADLEAVTSLLQLAAENAAADGVQFIEPVRELILLCRKPFVRRKANEEFQSVPQVAALLSQVSRQLSSSSQLISFAAVQVLFELLSKTAADATPASDARPNRWQYFHDVVARTDVVGTIVAAFVKEMSNLRDSPTSPVPSPEDTDAGAETWGAIPRGKYPSEFLMLLLQLVRELSQYQQSAIELNRQGMPMALADLLAVVLDFRSEFVVICVECLWNLVDASNENIRSGEVSLSLSKLLDKHRGANAVAALGNETSVWSLSGLFERLLIHGYRKQDKELRNEVVIVSTLVARRQANRHLFVSTGYFGLMLEYATAAEMGLPIPGDSRVFGTADPLDLELKRLLWLFIVEMASSEPSALPVVSDSLLLDSLIQYVQPGNSDNPYIAAWPPASRRMLDVLALQLLRQLAPQLPEKFAHVNGVVATLAHIRRFSGVLQEAVGQESVTTVGLSSTKAAAKEDDVDRQYHALQLLQAMCEFEDVREEIAGLGVLEDAIKLLSNVTPNAGTVTDLAPGTVTASTATPSRVTSGMVLEAVLSILATSLAHHQANQDAFRRAGGISMLLNWLRLSPADATFHPFLLCAAAAATSAAILGNVRSEARFLVDNGIDALLDLLDGEFELVHPQVLTILADLTSNIKSHPYLAAWRSPKSGRSAVGLLLIVWIRAEKRLGVSHEGDGELGSTDRPLGGAAAGPRGAAAAGDVAGGESPEAGSAFERLRRALRASKMWNMVEAVDPGSALHQAALAVDVRPKVYSILAAIHAEQYASGHVAQDETLTHEERIALTAAMQYHAFRIGQAWADVKASAGLDKLRLIAADNLEVEHHLDQLFTIAQEVKFAQHEIADEKGAAVSTHEQQFMDTMIRRKLGEEMAAIAAATAASKPKVPVKGPTRTLKSRNNRTQSPQVTM